METSGDSISPSGATQRFSDRRPSTGRPVLVVGMHRSGTSAVARVVNLLGLQLGPEDDLYSAPDNAAGHFESVALIEQNTRLLEAFGSRHTAAVHITAEMAATPRARELMAEASATFDRIYSSSDGWVWKDPRLCLTLPLWRSHPPVASAVSLLVFRHPIEVASSIHARDDRSLLHALALWERYTRLALEHSAGMAWARVHHADLLRDPQGTTEELAAALSRQGVAVTGVPAEAAAFIDPKLHRQRDLDTSPMSVAQRELHELTLALPPGGPSFVTPALPPETPTTEELLRRNRSGLRSQLRRLRRIRG